jgi:hypothetical protein
MGKTLRKEGSMDPPRGNLSPADEASRSEMKKGRIGRRQGRIGRAALRLVSFYGHDLSEGLPVPREPAYAVKRSQDGEAQAASE